MEDSPRLVPAVSLLRDTARKTYRYLRVSVVGMALLLAVALAIEVLWGDGERFGSLSGYYYSPVRPVFVGALLAIGPALVAIKGRTGWEDTLLDLAGMLAPVIALVPASLPAHREDVSCPGGSASCIPAEFLPSVENNVAALAALGALALLFAWLSAGRAGRRDRTTRIGLLAAVLTWALFSGAFVTARGVFLAWAHYAAAIAFFGCIAAVAHLNGRHSAVRGQSTGMTPRAYGRAYRAIGALMVTTLVLAALYHAVAAVAGVEPWFATIAVAEAVLLLLFAVFWVLQTVENWYEEVDAAPNQGG